MRSTLIAYQGGGYSGCFWEWNFALIDNRGKFHDLYSSGRNGCETKDDLMKMKDDWEEFNLMSEKDKEEFQADFPVNLVVDIIEKVNEIIPNTLFIRCEICNEKFVSGTVAGWHGIGGIASQAENFYCSTCTSERTCKDCETITGEGAYIDDEWVCKDCLNDYQRREDIPQFEEEFSDLKKKTTNLKRGLMEISVFSSYGTKEGQIRLVEEIEEILNEMELDLTDLL